jgi:hypothetical protein
MTCPCKDCLVLIRCKYKKFDKVFKECYLLREYLIRNSSSNQIQLSEERLYNYFDIMGIKVKRTERSINLIYPYE